MSVVKRNIVANFVSRMWSTVLLLALVPLYIKFLGVEAYGLVGFYATLQTLFSLLDMGLSTTLNRELARLSTEPDQPSQARDLVRTLEIVYWLVAAFIVLTLALLAPLLAHHWLNPRELSPATVRQALLMVSVVVALQFPFNLYSGGLLGLQRQVLLSWLVAAIATLRGGGAILILWLVSPTIGAFFLWQIVVGLIQTAVGAYLLWRELPKTKSVPRFDKELLLDTWRFAAGMMGINVVALLQNQADKVILSKVLTLEKLGYYTMASTVAMGLYAIVNPLFSAVFPRLAQMVSHHEAAGVSDFYHKSCQTMSVLLLPTAVVMSLFAPEILRLWTRDELIVENSHLIVSLLVVGTATNGLRFIPYALQLALGWTKLAFYQGVVSLSISIPLLFWAIAHYGAVGAAAVGIAVEVGYLVIGIQIMHTRLLRGEQQRWYYRDVALPLVGTLLVVVPGRRLFPQHMNPPAQLALILLILGVAMLAALALTPLRASLMKRLALQSLPSLK